ncbi:MAG TPA: acyl-CoA dehydrogenase family protein [Woeseiaceae bacterium]|nr:acyl-CoA dehydrogenase family protein [Woeseiaceae bacterium]
MHFEFTEQQTEIRDRARAFLDTHCDAGRLQQLARSDVFPEDLYTALASSGLLKVALPRAVGGDEAGLIGAAIVAEELARASSTLVNMYLVNTVFAGGLIMLAGSDEQRGRILPALAQGRCKLAFALTEPGAGSDAASVATSARRDGDQWVLDGQKRYTTGARNADYILVVTRTEADAKASQGMSVFLVPADAEGLDISPMDKITDNAYASCDLRLDGVRVGPEALLGGEAGLNRAWSALRVTGGMERVCVAASSLGLCRAVLADALAHAREREQFGRPIGQFQAIQHLLADMATSIEALHWLTYAGAWKADRGEDAGKEISMAKSFAAETVNRLVLEGLRILGGEGFLAATPMARYQREALLSLYAGGTIEIQKNLIARYL